MERCKRAIEVLALPEIQILHARYSDSREMKPRSRTKPKYRRSLVVFVCVFVLFALVYYLHLTHGLTVLNFGPKYQWKPEYGHLNGPDILPSDSRVIAKLQSKYLFAQDKDAAYNLSNPDWLFDPSVGQSIVIRRIFQNKKTPGFFIECGALDGETRSNTLYLERYLHWKGLLIEADPSNYEKLEKKHRQAWISPTCLSTKPYPTMVSFQQKENQGKIADFDVGFLHNGYVDAQCFPFETIMLAINVSTVDYFSLDVEGAELDILRTISFDKFDIKTLSVEFIHDVEGKVAIKEFMQSQGYFVHSEVTHPNWLANDFIFVKKSFYNTISAAEKEQIKKDIELQKENFSGNIVVVSSTGTENDSGIPDADFINDPL